MSNYGKTPQLRNMLHDARKAGVTGLITFKGTVKLHGTNAGIRQRPDGLIIPMSRNSDLVGGQDNYGFVKMVEREIDNITTMCEVLRKTHNIPDEDAVEIFGEWAGPGIQNGVGINNVHKKIWYIFAASSNGGEDKVWYDVFDLSTHQADEIYNINAFKTFMLVLNIENPESVLSRLTSLVNDVEAECPVTMEMANEVGVGEGIVWEYIDGNGKRLVFKTKGEKHSVSKVKKVTDVAPEVLENIEKFVVYAVTENRVRQAMDAHQADSRVHTGNVMRWITNDIIEEEADVLEASGLTWKQVAKQATNRARQIFFADLDSSVI